jgi:hypothetical protein
MQRPDDLPQLIWREGLHLAGSILWFDAPRRHHLSLLSHAAIGARPRGRVLATAATAALLGLDASSALVAAYGRTLSLGRLRIELLPSGVMLGAAQARIECAAGTVLYAGELRPGGSPTAVAPRPHAADVLAIDVGRLLASAAPPREEAVARLVRILSDALDQGRQPVIRARSPGTAQDLIFDLEKFPLRAHRKIVADSRLYAAHGVRLPSVRGFGHTLGQGEVLLWPTDARVRVPAALPRALVVEIDEAASPASADASSPEIALALCPGIDEPAFLSYVEAVGPARVHLTARQGARPGAERAVARLVRTLGRRGIPAVPLGSPSQMRLFHG